MEINKKTAKKYIETLRSQKEINDPDFFNKLEDDFAVLTENKYHTKTNRTAFFVLATLESPMTKDELADLMEAMYILNVFN